MVLPHDMASPSKLYGLSTYTLLPWIVSVASPTYTCFSHFYAFLEIWYGNAVSSMYTKDLTSLTSQWAPRFSILKKENLVTMVIVTNEQ